MLMASPQWMFETDLPDDVISNSLRFNQGDSPHLELASLSGGSNTKGTISFWCKRGALSDDMRMWSNYAGSGTDRNQIGFLAADTLTVQIGDTAMRTTNRVFRDTINWYHIVVAYDSEQSTANDRIKVYVNGVQETSFGTTNNPSEDAEIFINNDKIYWGRRETSSLYFDGYLAECIQIDGSQLTPTSFGKEVGNVWIPIDTSGLTFGTNGYRLQYLQTGTSQNASGIGADTSGNTKHFAVTNLAASDVVIDTPENSFCTINFQAQSLTSTVTASEGNLFFDGSTLSPSNYDAGVICNFGMKGGRWYWETRLSGGGTPADARDWNVGFAPYSTISKSVDDYTYGQSLGHGSSATLSGYGYTQVNGGGTHGIRHNNSTTAFGSAHTSGDIIGHALDLVNGTWQIYKNGVLLGTAVTGLDTSLTYFAAGGANGGTISSFDVTFNFGQDDTFAGAVSSNGNTGGGGKFRYTPPAGFSACCSRNLSEPAFSANPTRPENADDNFNPYGYTADNTDNKARTGMGFQPDFLWFKDRDTGFSHNLYDSSRGANKYIQSNNTGTENTTSDLMSSFDSDGFTTQNDSSSGNLLNYSSDKYIVWSWKANAGTTSSNDSGDITTTVQVNTKAGFSIITYTGSGTDGDTIGHGLNQQPDFIIGTPRDSSGSNRVVWHKEISLGTFLKLNLTDAVATSDQFLSVSDTLIGVGGNANLSGKAQVIWCWHEIEGYSKFGKYTGNGNADGAYIHLGFKPALVATKKTSGTGNWYVNDSTRSNYNPTNTSAGNLYWESSNTESGNGMDLLSSGFKIRNTDSSQNANGGTFVYMAWAESPFKYSNAA